MATEISYATMCRLALEYGPLGDMIKELCKKINAAEHNLGTELLTLSTRTSQVADQLNAGMQTTSLGLADAGRRAEVAASERQLCWDMLGGILTTRDITRLAKDRS
jgi:hypothetical protein